MNAKQTEIISKMAEIIEVWALLDTGDACVTPERRENAMQRAQGFFVFFRDSVAAIDDGEQRLSISEELKQARAEIKALTLERAALAQASSRACSGLERQLQEYFGALWCVIWQLGGTFDLGLAAVDDYGPRATLEIAANPATPGLVIKASIRKSVAVQNMPSRIHEEDEPGTTALDAGAFHHFAPDARNAP